MAKLGQSKLSQGIPNERYGHDLSTDAPKVHVVWLLQPFKVKPFFKMINNAENKQNLQAVKSHNFFQNHAVRRRFEIRA